MKSLKEKRIKAGVSQETMAGILDVTTRTIRNWESGKIEISYVYMKEYLRILDDVRK